MAIDDILAGQGFPKATYVRSGLSIADLFPTKQRCGIYVLHFLNDQYYVGQSVDIARRYREHCKHHSDIEKISFKLVGKRQLDNEEAEVIWLLEDENFHLRNIDMTSILSQEPSTFDEIMSPQEQQQWLLQPDSIDLEGNRPFNAKRKQLYSERYQRFRQMSCAGDVTEVLRQYIYAGMPAIKRGEASYWAVSCLPPPPYDVLVRVNVNWQEVFLINRTEDNMLWFYLCLSIREIKRRFDNSPERFSARHPEVEWHVQRYKAGGADQMVMEGYGKQAALRLLNDPDIIPAIRLYNLRIMKKGKCPWAKSHSFDLIDEILSK